MSYINPNMVVSPKGLVGNLNVLYNGGENEWALAEMTWDGNPAMALRWNGGSDDPRFPGIGNPQSRGVPTWFVLPDEVADAVIHMLKLAKKIAAP